MLAGDFSRTGMVIANYTDADPGCAPEGHSVLVMMSLAPWDYQDVWGTAGDLSGYSDNPEYLRIKDEASERLIDRAERLIPELRDSIVVKEVATPLTNVRYGLSPEGSIYGRQQTVENLLNRRSPKTPIPNLFLAGAWVGGGGMSTALASGRTAAAIAGRLLTPG
jgi:prolycopene isomerase